MKKTSASALSAFLMLLMVLSSIAPLTTSVASTQNPSTGGQINAPPSSMTFTSGEKIKFTSGTEMTIANPNYMQFWSGVEMTFSSTIKMRFVEFIDAQGGPPNGILEPCDWLQVTAPIGFLPPQCSWWEVVDTTGNPIGEFHVDYTTEPDLFHVDIVWGPTGGPFPINPPPGENIAVKKIEIIEYCQYYEVHWPSHWWPQECTWWELIDPETGELTGIEFHVDWTNESCEFHIDEVIPGPYQLPFPWYELKARQKIDTIQSCDYFVAEEPTDWWPQPCTWWEILDPFGNPTHFEFHVDWTNESCEFHIDEVTPEPYILPVPGVPFVIAQQKIVNITRCDWFIVVDPQGYLPDTCSWWEILDDTGAPTGLEFHVDETISPDGFTMFHIDDTTPDIVITIPPSYTVTVRKKIDDIVQCSWFKVADPDLTPEICTWWEVLDPTTGEPTGWEFHVDARDPAYGWFHVDEVIRGPSDIGPIHELTAEKKIDTIQQCDWFLATDPSGYIPPTCSFWEVVSPVDWARVIFHVDSNDGLRFHVDYVEPTPPSIVPPPHSVTAVPYEPTPPPWFKKPPYPDYAPSGMPDFDQHQDTWGPAQGLFTWCGPVSVANSLWWFDSKFDPSEMVTPYGPWDDHDPRNVDPLVQNLAFLMDTDGRRTGLTHTGTSYIDMETGISQYLQQQGINPLGDCDGDGDVDDDDITIINNAWGSFPGSPTWDMRADIIIDNVVNNIDLVNAGANYGLTGMFYEHTEEYPDFGWIEDEIYRCEDVVLFLDFWYFDGIEWIPLYDNPSLEAGHFVTCAGVNSSEFELLISDPYWDPAEAGWPGHVPVPHPYPHPPTVHNDTQYVSHDAYGVALWTGPPPPTYSPVPFWELVGYLQQLGYPPNWYAFIRAAVVTSPLGTHDINVTGISRYRTIAYETNRFTYRLVNVTVLNEGTFNETFDLTVKVNGSSIGTQSVFLATGDTTTRTFIWNTNGWTKGDYTISAHATPVPGEADLSDNDRVDSNVFLTVLGDVSGDRKVDITDISMTIAAYGKTKNSPGWRSPTWYANRDVNDDDKIDISDISTVISQYGAVW